MNKENLIFIDESGDSGFKPASSACFVIALVIFDSNEEAQKTDNAIEKLRFSSGIKHEYKFSKTNDHFKEQFFECVKQFPFTVSAIIVTKNKIESRELRTNPKKFYNFFLKQILQKSPIFSNSRIKIDKSSSKAFQTEMKNYLNKQTVINKLHFKFENSKSNNLIQLADMVSGAVLRSCTQKHDCDKWIKFVKEKLINLWHFK